MSREFNHPHGFVEPQLDEVLLTNGQDHQFRPVPFDPGRSILPTSVEGPVVAMVHAGNGSNHDRIWLRGSGNDHRDAPTQFDVVLSKTRRGESWQGVHKEITKIGELSNYNSDLVIGRLLLEQAGITNPDSTLSRAQALISFTGTDLIVKDLASTNGTKLVYGTPSKADHTQIFREAHPTPLSGVRVLESKQPDSPEKSVVRSVGLAERPLHGEDCILSRPDLGLFGVFDGAGGGGGDPARTSRAARHTVEHVIERLPDASRSAEQTAQALKYALEVAHKAIVRNADKLGGITTASIVQAVEQPDGKRAVAWALVGDSPMFVYNRLSKQISQLGYEEGEGRFLRNCIGGDNPNQPATVKQYGVHKVLHGDQLIICSDGITGDVGKDIMPPAEIAEIAKSASSAQELAQLLITVSRKRDDKSVIVVNP